MRRMSSPGPPLLPTGSGSNRAPGAGVPQGPHRSTHASVSDLDHRVRRRTKPGLRHQRGSLPRDRRCFRLRIAIRHTLARVPRPIRNCRAPGHETLHQQELPARLRSSGSPGTGCCGERRRAGRFGRCVSSAALSLWSPPCGSPGCAVSTYRSLSFARSFSVSCYLSGADDSSWLRCRRCTVVGSGYGSRSASRVLRDRDLRVRAGI